MVKKAGIIGSAIVALAASLNVAAKRETPGAFENSNKRKINPPGSKLARKAAEKTLGVRVPTATCVIGGRVHIRGVE